MRFSEFLNTELLRDQLPFKDRYTFDKWKKFVGGSSLSIRDVLLYTPKKHKRVKHFPSFSDALRETEENAGNRYVVGITVTGLEYDAKKCPRTGQRLVNPKTNKPLVPYISVYDSNRKKIHCSYFSDYLFNDAVKVFNTNKPLLILCEDYKIFKGRFYASNPKILESKESWENLDFYVPSYELPKGITDKTFRSLVKATFALMDESKMECWYNEGLDEENNWWSQVKSLQIIHCTTTQSIYHAIETAYKRLLFDELLCHQILLNEADAIVRNDKIEVRDIFSDEFSKHVWTGFRLTNCQQEFMKVINRYIQYGNPANVLLQGDVGTGKTICAFGAMLNSAFHSDSQSAFLGPTELLAEQTYAVFCERFPNLADKTCLLTGSKPTKKRKEKLKEAIEAGEYTYIIGTHALLEEDVRFNKLHCCVIDEQHRFGVEQRIKLNSKMPHSIHTISMSATPIPRTMLMCNYGSIHSVNLTETPNLIPNNRTTSKYEKTRGNLATLIQRIKDYTDKGKQAYWVCPLITESKSLMLKDIETRYASFIESGLFNEGDVAILHGRLKSKDKLAITEKFRNGEIKVLIATTVIEVGIDIHNANLMIVEHPEMFGLAQLHQLRGRVGRGQEKGYFIMLYGDAIGQTCVQRMQVMCDTQDGFVIAEKDLRLRGGGNILTTEQTGYHEFVFGQVAFNEDLLEMANEYAVKIKDEDTTELKALFKQYNLDYTYL